MPTTFATGRSGRFGHRRAIASLELAMALPILVVLISIIFAICSTAECRMVVTTMARNAAFEKRHRPWQHQPQRLEIEGTSKVKAILGNQPRMVADGGLVSGTATGQPQNLFGPLSALKLSSTSQRAVLGGGWDYEELKFKKHPALTLTEKATYFGVAERELDNFKQLASFGAGLVGDSSLASAQAQVSQATRQAQQNISERLAQLQRELKQLQEQRKRQREQLTDWERSVASDPEAVRRLRSKVRTTEREINDLQSERIQQQRARASIGIDLTMPMEQPDIE